MPYRAEVNWVLATLLFCVTHSSAQVEGGASPSDELVDDVVGQSLFGNVKSEDLVNLLNEQATFGSSAEARADESAVQASAHKSVVVASPTSTASPLLAAAQKLRNLDAWATRKAALAAAARAAAARLAKQVTRPRMKAKAGAQAKAAPATPQAQLGLPPVDIADNEDVSSNLGGLLDPVPVPDAADLIVKMDPPVDHPDLLSPAPSHELSAQVVKMPQAVLNDAGERAMLPSPKPRLRKPPVVPKASLGSSLGEVVSDDNLIVATDSSLKIDLPAAPSATAIAAATEANHLPEDLESLGDIDSLDASLSMSGSNVSTQQRVPGIRSRSAVHKIPVVAASLGPSLGEAVPSNDVGANSTAAESASKGGHSDDNPDAQDSFLDEGLDGSSEVLPPQRRSVDRTRADASVLHALDSEVQRGAAASAAEIDAAEAESEAGASNVALPEVPLWGAPQPHAP